MYHIYLIMKMKKQISELYLMPACNSALTHRLNIFIYLIEYKVSSMRTVLPHF